MKSYYATIEALVSPALEQDAKWIELFESLVAPAQLGSSVTPKKEPPPPSCTFHGLHQPIELFAAFELVDRRPREIF